MSEVLSVKIEKEKLKLLEEIAKEEESDRSAVARRLLDVGIRKWKMDKAVELFKDGRVSVWRAAHIAGVSLREFIDVLNGRRVVWVGIEPEELEAEARAIMKEAR